MDKLYAIDKIINIVQSFQTVQIGNQLYEKFSH